MSSAEVTAFMMEMRQGMSALNARLDTQDARFDALSSAVTELRDEANLQHTRSARTRSSA